MRKEFKLFYSGTNETIGMRLEIVVDKVFKDVVVVITRFGDRIMSIKLALEL